MNEHEAWVAEWFRKADGDLETARTILESGKILHESVCFHCQQCVEKLLKGFLILHERPVSKTHDLERLLEECSGIEPSFSMWEEPCVILTDYAVDVRYPDNFIQTTSDHAREALGFAEAIWRFVLEQCPAFPPRL